MPHNTRVGGLKQQSLSFPSRRSIAASDAKGKDSKSPSIAPPKADPIAAKDEGVSDAEAPDDVQDLPSTSRQRRRKTVAAEVAGEEKKVSRKRKVQDVGDLPSSSAKGKEKEKGKEKKAKRVFKSRVSIENTEDARVAPYRESDSSEAEVEAITDTSERAKKQRLLRHYQQVRHKMGNIEPSAFILPLAHISRRY